MSTVLTTTEIAFLNSLDDSALLRLLGELPREDQTAILSELHQNQEPAPSTEPQGARERSRKHAKKERRASQEIGPLPPPPLGEDAELRKRSDASLRDHFEIVYPNAFTIAWSPDHLRLIEHLEKAATIGLLKALAMARGSGKTTIFIRAILWALLTRRRRYGVIIGPTEAVAEQHLKTVKSELQNNDMLARLYPQETHCLRMLEGESRLASGQRFNGELTDVEWRQHRINFGYVEGVLTSGATLAACGLTGSLRGQQTTLPSGEVLRPDLLGVDDPQTKESAKSPTQTKTRHELMMGDVLGMAGPNRKVAGVCTGTVIYKNDLIDRILDRQQSPAWNGDKCKLVYEWGTGRELWDQYRTMLEAEWASGGDGSKATAFVKKNFKAMHAGSEVGWAERHDPSELSALQHAWNLRIRDEVTFFAEYQNEPLGEVVDVPWELDPIQISRRTNNVTRNRIPENCEKITCFIDVQKNVLFFTVCAWEMTGRGHVIDYGTYPQQNSNYFTKRSLSRTLRQAAGTDDMEEAIYAGLEELTGALFKHRFRRINRTRGDVDMRLDRCGIDARWGYSTRIIRQFCRETEHLGRIHPTMGHYIGADSLPWHRWSHHKTDMIGAHCKLQAPPKGIRGVRELLVDTNWWKSYCAERLDTHKGAEKAILLFKNPPHMHRMFAEHCCSEEPVTVTGKIGNKAIEWTQPVEGLENDFWDCLVGNCVLSSIEGVRIDAKKRPPAQSKPRRKYGVRSAN